jgi:predicted membrane channel-forming protein YqfA (hemolysin III family)
MGITMKEQENFSESRLVFHVLAFLLLGLSLASAMPLIDVRTRPSGFLALFLWTGFPYVLGTFSFIVWFLVPTLSYRNILAVISAQAICGYLLTNTRGSWIWPGTFDLYEAPRSWISPWAIGILTGFLARLVFGFLRKPVEPAERAATTQSILVPCSMLVAATLIEGGLSILCPIESRFPATRYVAFSVFLVLGTVGLVLLKEVYEKRI